MIKPFVRLYIRLHILKNKFFQRPWSPPPSEEGALVILYRISDAGYNKVKPAYIHNENCLRNATTVFPPSRCPWQVIADNCSEETLRMIFKYIPADRVRQVSIGHGAGTFNLAYDLALEYRDEDSIYFLENDYLHTADAMEVLREGLKVSRDCEYISLYDHPDKYNPSHRVKSLDEKTTVFLSPSRHWKITSSTTMTFAARVETLKRDEGIFRRWTKGRHPYDFRIFMNLRLQKRRLLTPLPAASTHGETAHLSPLVNWEDLAGSIK